MILVTGATGHLGKMVVQHLLQHIPQHEFAVLARSAEKAKPYLDQDIRVIYGDFDQPETLNIAFQNVDKLLLISMMEQNRLQQHKNVIDAAKHAGVKHMVYTGLAIQDIEHSAVKALMLSHFETEEYIKQSGLTYTLLRNTMYAEAIPQIIGSQVLEHGIAVSGALGQVPYVTRAGLGEATANVLVESGHENTTYQLVGSQLYDYQAIADIFRTLLKDQ